MGLAYFLENMRKQGSSMHERCERHPKRKKERKKRKEKKRKEKKRKKKKRVEKKRVEKKRVEKKRTEKKKKKKKKRKEKKRKTRKERKKESEALSETDGLCASEHGLWGIGFGGSPIGYAGFMSCFKVQGNFLLLCSSNNFVGYSYDR